MHEDLTPTRIQTISLAVLAVVAAMFSIYWLRPVLVPLVVALFVVSGVSPILNTLEKRLGVTKLVAAAMTFLAGVVILLLFGLAIWTSLQDVRQNSEEYVGRVREIVRVAEAKLADWLPAKKIADLQASSALAANQPRPQPDSDLTGVINNGKEDPGEQAADGDQDGESDQELNDKASQFVDAIVRDGLAAVSQALLNLVTTSIVVLIYVFFLLIGTPTVTSPSPTVREIDRQVRSYLSLKTIISIFTGLAFGMALKLFGVPMAFTFGVMAFLLNFVPNVGPLAASLLPIPLIVLDPSGNLVWMISVISVTCLIQAISGNIVEPRIMGNSSDLHPVTILVALMFWGMMWGIIGMFLATPITAAVKIILQRLETTKPIADLMAGRWGETQWDAGLSTTPG